MTPLEALGLFTVKGATVSPPNPDETQIEKTTYAQVKKMLIKAGGKWVGGKSQHFKFPMDAGAIMALLKGGEVLDFKKLTQFFPTPFKVAQEMIDRLRIDDESELVFLEPGIGHGALAMALQERIKELRESQEIVEAQQPTLFYFEKSPIIADVAKQTLTELPWAKLHQLGEDYLSTRNPGTFPYIIMNPPFAKGEYADHFLAAFSDLAPGGEMVSVLPVGFWTTSTGKPAQFFEWLNPECKGTDVLRAGHFSWERESDGAIFEWSALGEEAFKSSGTKVATGILSVKKAGKISARNVMDIERPPLRDLSEEADGKVQKTQSPIFVSTIVPNPYQPRREFDQAELEELAKSIKENGLMQKIGVRDTGDPNKFELIYGERRLRAHRLLGLETIDAEVYTNLSNAKMMAMALEENAKRQDVDPLDEAQLFARLREAGQPVEVIAATAGVSTRTIERRLLMLQVPEPIIEAYRKGYFNAAHLLKVAPYPEDAKNELAKWVKKKGDDFRDSVPSPTSIERILQRELFSLHKAVFDTSVPYAGEPACKGCPFNTGSELSLFDSGDSMPTCTKGECYDKKSNQWVTEARAKAAEALGTEPGKTKVIQINAWQAGTVEAADLQSSAWQMSRTILCGEKARTLCGGKCGGVFIGSGSDHEPNVPSDGEPFLFCESRLTHQGCDCPMQGPLPEPSEILRENEEAYEAHLVEKGLKSDILKPHEMERGPHIHYSASWKRKRFFSDIESDGRVGTVKNLSERARGNVENLTQIEEAIIFAAAAKGLRYFSEAAASLIGRPLTEAEKEELADGPQFFVNWYMTLGEDRNFQQLILAAVTASAVNHHNQVSHEWQMVFQHPKAEAYLLEAQERYMQEIPFGEITQHHEAVKVQAREALTKIAEFLRLTPTSGPDYLQSDDFFQFAEESKAITRCARDGEKSFPELILSLLLDIHSGTELEYDLSLAYENVKGAPFKEAVKQLAPFLKLITQ